MSFEEISDNIDEVTENIKKAFQTQFVKAFVMTFLSGVLGGIIFGGCGCTCLTYGCSSGTETRTLQHYEVKPENVKVNETVLAESTNVNANNDSGDKAFWKVGKYTYNIYTHIDNKYNRNNYFCDSYEIDSEDFVNFIDVEKNLKYRIHKHNIIIVEKEEQKNKDELGDL